MTTNNIPPNLRQGFFSDDRVTPAADQTIKAGDMVWIDTAYKARVLTNDTNAANFIGVSNDQWPTNVYDPDIQEQAETIKVLGVDVIDFKTTAGETYQPYQKLYVGADAQTVTNVAGSYPIGTVTNEPNNFALVGAAGVKINVNVRRRVPNDVAIS